MRSFNSASVVSVSAKAGTSAPDSRAAVDLLLPETADLVGTVDANAASVTLCASPDVGLRLIVDENITTSNNYGDAGLVRSGNTWETPGYATAATKIELRTGGGAASFTLDTTGGCR